MKKKGNYKPLFKPFKTHNMKKQRDYTLILILVIILVSYLVSCTPARYGCPGSAGKFSGYHSK